MSYINDISVLEQMPWLNEKRKQHIISTADTAKLLALKYEPALADKAYVAGLYHDCAKGIESELICKYSGLTDFEKIFSTIHAPLGAYIAKDIFDVEDQDILNAIYWHCTGKADMNTLEKIVFIADAIEPQRQYSGVDIIRNRTFKNLDDGVLCYLHNLLNYLNDQNKDINPYTVECYEYYRGIYEKRDKSISE